MKMKKKKIEDSEDDELMKGVIPQYCVLCSYVLLP